MRKVLIANRGEIACRVIRACRTLGLSTVAVFSEADARALHVEMADEAAAIGPGPARESYLLAENVLDAARATGADAIHPGYGFLAESAAFAEAVAAAGLIWIGPDAGTMADMGDKERAREIAVACGLPVVPGSARFTAGNLEGIGEAAEALGFPLLVKASAGGGGIGMRRVDVREKLLGVAEATQSMAAKAFGDGAIYLERLVPKARHVEIQVFGWGDGRAVHLFERDCSTQRRFQKVIEESPAPNLSHGMRGEMAAAAVALCRDRRYRGAGTVEFILDAETSEFFFLEMNTRIQVEHPVTEMVTGVDLVALQINLARGAAPPLEQEVIGLSGHAIECRIYAERPEKNFLPSPGTLTEFALPEAADGVRIDTGFRAGDEVSFFYDPMIAKVICHAGSRGEAIEKMAAALGSIRIRGIASNLDFLAKTVTHGGFRAGDVFTGFIDAHKADLIGV